MLSQRVDIDENEVDRLIRIVELSRSLIANRKMLDSYNKGHFDRVAALEKAMAFEEMELKQLRAKDTRPQAGAV